MKPPASNSRAPRRLAAALAAGFLIAALSGAVGIRGAAPARAAEPALGARDKADIARVEAYLNTIRTLRADFIQTASSGAFAEGRFYLRRPGRLRFDYSPAGTLQMFADGFSLIYVDHELEQITHVPLSATPAGVLIDDNVKLSGKLRVTRIDRGPAILRVHLVRSEDPDSGILVLTLSDRPLALRQWTVIDAKGIATRVSLVNPEFNIAIDESVFVFETPDWAEEKND